MASGLALEASQQENRSADARTAHLPPVQHPLEPLNAEEIALAVTLLRAAGKLSAHTRLSVVVLSEPPKDVVLGWEPGAWVPREVYAQVLDNADGQVYEAIVSLTEAVIKSWTHIPGVQPSLMLDEFFECEEVVKRHPDFLAALARRGVTDPALAMVDPWSAGWYGDEDERGIRLARALTFIRSEPGDNGYAHPLEGVISYVDLNKMEVVRIEDHGVVPLPPAPGNYSQDYIQDFRPDLKPIDIIQSEGASFTVAGHEIKWQKWSFRIGFTPREGLVLYQVGYEDGGRVRPIMYRASLSEMVVPYGDPHPNHNRKNAFDVGEYGIGTLANALELGCDCLGEIRYFDTYMATSRGDVTKMPNVVCMHEEDFGILWKHVDWRTGQTEVRRSRRLVVSFIATVGNYEYGFFWYFYQDGTIQYEVKLTGIINTGALPLGETRPYGTLVAPGLYAPNHLHHFNVRLDMMVDGVQNSIYEVHSEIGARRAGEPARQRLCCQIHTAEDRAGGAAAHRPAQQPLLEDRQSPSQKRSGPASRLQADAGRERPQLHAGQRLCNPEGRLYCQAPVGDAL